MNLAAVFTLAAIIVTHGDAGNLTETLETSLDATVIPFNSTETRARILTHIPDNLFNFDTVNDFQATPPLLPFRRTDAVPERERGPSTHPYDPFASLPLGLNLQTNNIVAFSTLEPSLTTLPGIIESVQSINNDWTPISRPTQTQAPGNGFVNNIGVPTTSSPSRIRPNPTRGPTSVPTVTAPLQITPSRTRIPTNSPVSQRIRTTTPSPTVPNLTPSPEPQETVITTVVRPTLQSLRPKLTANNGLNRNATHSTPEPVRTTTPKLTTFARPTTTTEPVPEVGVTTEFPEENTGEFTTFMVPSTESSFNPELSKIPENQVGDNELGFSVTIAPVLESGEEKDKSEETVGTTWLPVTFPNFIEKDENVSSESEIPVSLLTPVWRSTTPATVQDAELGTGLGASIDQPLPAIDTEINVIDPGSSTDLYTSTTLSSVLNSTFTENTVQTNAETEPTTPQTTTQVSKTKTTTGRALTTPFDIPFTTTVKATSTSANPTRILPHIAKDEESSTPSPEYYSPAPTKAYTAGLEPGIIAAIVVSAFVFLLILLAIMMIILRKRQVRSAAYARRCNPSRLDAFNMDNVSPNQSFRRGSKSKLRASKRSFLNFAFDDNTGPSNSLTGAQLALYLEKEPSIEAEFSHIPNPGPRLDELPKGAEAKNRYANVIPVPETRVVLAQIEEDPTSDYINANYIKGPKEEDKFYIASQGPMESTVEDFWRMAWETRAKLVFQLTDFLENGVARCAEYLPPSEVLDCHRLFGDFQVTLKKRELKENFVISFLQLKNLEENLAREVTHYWYSGWPTQGVPQDPRDVVNILLEARTLLHNHPGPAIVHCSPGTGRTGTLIAIDIALRHIDEHKCVDIPRIVSRIRQERGGCVQTKEQLSTITRLD